MRIKRKVYDAYFTVEASFIIPIVLFLLVLILQWGFFCYEKSIALQCCYLSALRASDKWELSGRELENYATEQAEYLLAERNLYPVNRKSNAKITLMGIEVELDNNMDVLFAKTWGSKESEWYWEEKKQAGRIVPSEYIRKYHMIENAGGGDNGSNQ